MSRAVCTQGDGKILFARRGETPLAYYYWADSRHIILLQAYRRRFHASRLTLGSKRPDPLYRLNRALAEIVGDSLSSLSRPILSPDRHWLLWQEIGGNSVYSGWWRAATLEGTEFLEGRLNNPASDTWLGYSSTTSWSTDSRAWLTVAITYSSSPAGVKSTPVTVSRTLSNAGQCAISPIEVRVAQARSSDWAKAKLVEYAQGQSFEALLTTPGGANLVTVSIRDGGLLASNTISTPNGSSVEELESSPNGDQLLLVTQNGVASATSTTEGRVTTHLWLCGKAGGDLRHVAAWTSPASQAPHWFHWVPGENAISYCVGESIRELQLPGQSAH